MHALDVRKCTALLGHCSLGIMLGFTLITDYKIIVQAARGTVLKIEVSGQKMLAQDVREWTALLGGFSINMKLADTLIADDWLSVQASSPGCS